MSLYYYFQAIISCFNSESGEVVSVGYGETISEALRHIQLRLSVFPILWIKEERLYNYLITCIILNNWEMEGARHFKFEV